jgi:hypothetical protein
MSGHPHKEVRKTGEGVRLATKGKGRLILREVIQDD